LIPTGPDSVRRGFVAQRAAQAIRVLRGSDGLRHFALATLLLVQGGCALVGPAPSPAAPEVALAGPPIRSGLRTPEEALQAARLIREGEELLSAGSVQAARERGVQVEVELPEADGSSWALWLIARADEALGVWESSAGYALRFASLHPRESPEAFEAVLLASRARFAGELLGGIEVLFGLPEELEEGQRMALGQVGGEWAEALQTSELRDLLREAPPHRVLTPLFQLELSLRRYLAGDRTEAEELARGAVGLLREGSAEQLRARRILEGRLEEEISGGPALGLVLTTSGSPGLRQLSEEIREGVELALVVEEGGHRLPLRLVLADDQGELARASQAMATLEEEGVFGVVGPLLDALVSSASRARTNETVILSPTLRLPPEGVPGVFSLSGVDPEAARQLARLALREGARSVLILHGSDAESREELRWFREEFRAGGGIIQTEVSVPSGATGFEVPLRQVVALSPRSLVILATPDDLERLAPQLAFYGVSELEELQLFGGEGWSSSRALQTIPTRHTDGVLTVTSRPGSGEALGPGWVEFVRAYEEHFQRTLRSVGPAFGYDAARILIHASREGGGTPSGTRRALESLRGYQGATGVLTYEGGRLVREFHPVQIRDRQLLPYLP